jgi:hypothetical protein
MFICTDLANEAESALSSSTVRAKTCTLMIKLKNDKNALVVLVFFFKQKKNK